MVFETNSYLLGFLFHNIFFNKCYLFNYENTSFKALFNKFIQVELNRKLNCLKKKNIKK